MDDRHYQRINNTLEEGMAGKNKRNPLSRRKKINYYRTL